MGGRVHPNWTVMDTVSAESMVVFGNRPGRGLRWGETPSMMGAKSVYFALCVHAAALGERGTKRG